MKYLQYKSENEDGFILVISLLMLVILTLFGVFALNTTVVEQQIAGNDRVHKDSFYKAESGDMLAVELLEQNIYCATGFDKTSAVTTYDGVTSVDVTDVGTFIAGDPPTVRTHGWTTGAPNHSFEGLAFYLNEKPWETTVCNVFMPGQPNISYPISSISNDITIDTERTDVYLGGSVRKLPGGSLQMAAGYERLGKSAAGGGAVRGYDIISRYRGIGSSEAVVVLGWDHLIGTEYDAASGNYCN